MNRTRALYSIIQYIPDSGRAEGANAGVVLFVPSAAPAGRIEIRISPTLERVRQFFKPNKRQLRRVELGIESLKHRLELARAEFEDEGQFEQFVASRADAVRLTKPRPAVVTDPRAELDELYAELVGDPDVKERVAPKHVSLPPRVAEVFGRLEAERRAWRPKPLRVPGVRRPFEVSLAYQNGVTNYVRTESLANRNKAEGLLPQLGFNGQLISQHPIDEQKGKLVVLSTDPAADRETEERFRDTLEEFNVRFIPYQEAEEFAEDVEKTAH